VKRLKTVVKPLSGAFEWQVQALYRRRWRPILVDLAPTHQTAERRAAEALTRIEKGEL
jgi:hypothetical protein